MKLIKKALFGTTTNIPKWMLLFGDAGDWHHMESDLRLFGLLPEEGSNAAVAPGITGRASNGELSTEALKAYNSFLSSWRLAFKNNRGNRTLWGQDALDRFFNALKNDNHTVSTVTTETKPVTVESSHNIGTIALDMKDGITKTTRAKHKASATLTDGDTRHYNNGAGTRVLRNHFGYLEEMVRKVDLNNKSLKLLLRRLASTEDKFGKTSKEYKQALKDYNNYIKGNRYGY